MITVNMDKAKAIAHEIRRAKRTVEFSLLDEIIAKKIPGNDATVAETQRQAIRDKYAVMQTKITTAKTPAELKTILFD